MDRHGYWDGEGALLRETRVRRLSYQQRLDLLHDPHRLLSSARAAELFATPRVLILEPEREGRVLATYFDLPRRQRVRLIADPEQSTEQARAQLIQMAQNEYGPYSVAVVVNTASGRYHLREATHQSPDAPLREMPSSYLAREQGFTPCDICFEPRPVESADELEKQLGRLLAQQVEGQFRLSQNQSAIERVNRVGQRLLEGNELEADYRFVVLESERVNAFAVPTGPLYVTTGLLGVVESDDELAAVMGHELAHAELHHGRRQYEQAQQWSWLSLLAGIATRNAWLYSATQAFGAILNRGYSRDFELEADRQGTWYAFGAGYRADHFKLTLRKFQDLEARRGGGGFYWLRTHPGSEHRLQEVDDVLGRLEPLQLLLEEVEPDDPGLAAHLKRRGSEFLENPQEVVAFYQAYRQLVSAP